MALTSIKGIGPALAKALTRLLGTVDAQGSVTPPIVRDLMFHVPTGTIDRSQITPIIALKNGDYATLKVRVDEHQAPPRNRPRIPYKVAVHDDSGELILTFFHVKNDYLSRQLPPGEWRIISGSVDFYDGIPTIAHPDMIAPIEKAAEILRLSPSYPLTLGLSQRTLSKLTAQLAQALKTLPEWLDASLLAAQHWQGFTASLKALHLPQQPLDIIPSAPARARLAYDELLANQLALGLSRTLEKRAQGQVIAANEALLKQLQAALPFTFTHGQTNVLEEIMNDLASGERMVRLLQGDVGSGKTILAFVAMAQCAKAGFQAALMAPTDLLARQHLATLRPLAEALHIPIALMSGKMKAAERANVTENLASGNIPLVIGTHALFQEEVAFQNLALIVVDEQHRFGVTQRMQLAAKGNAPHLLQMTATPIPRSLTMTLYGDMDVSLLTEKPPGRQDVDTRAMPTSRMEEVVEGLARVMKSGEKIYWVCPLIEESDASELAAAEERFAALQQHFEGKVGLVHGRMKLAEREKVMQEFAFGNLQLLVATTVIEVGVNVPEATVMVVEHAERFGLAQLHQLRGRVGRGSKPSRCVLLYHTLSALVEERLKILRATNDGFAIAEKDLELRGAGDVLGVRQTGLPDFKLVDFGQHMRLIRMAHQDARAMLANDPDLLSERGRALRLLLALFEYDAALVRLKTI
jgi:ATP-dependent DNA helicase RecG